MQANRSIPGRLRHTALAALAICAASVQAAPVSWVGPNASFWDLAVNWSPGLPGAADDALLGAFDTVFRSGSVSINSLLGSGTLTVSGGALSLAGASSTGGLLLSGGTLGGAGALTVSGAMQWTAGTMSGSGASSLNGGATLSGGGFKDTTGRAITFAGNTAWTNTADGNGRIRTGSGAGLVNAGNWLDQNVFDNRISNDFGGAASSFNNNGSYTKSGSANVDIGITFNNPGNVSVQAGTLSLSGGGTSNGGSFDIASGAVLAFTGGAHALNGIGTGSGSGLISVRGGSVDTSGSFATAGSLEVSGGALNAGGPSSAAGLSFSGGTIAGAGALAIAGATQWTAGTMSGSGSAALNGAALSGGGFKDITGRSVTFAGATTWTNTADGNGRIRTGSGAGLVNTGTWLDQNAFDNRISNDFGGSVSSFSNNGSYTKSGSANVDIGITFNNPGTVNVQTGTLSLSGGGTSNGGTFDIAAGAVLAFTGGAHALNGISTGSGSGLISVRGGSVDTSGSFATAGNLEVSGGALNVGGPGSAAGLLFRGGTIAGTGTLTIAGATQWTAGTLNGSGSILLNGSTTLSGGGFKDITSRSVTFAGATTWTNTADGNGRIRTGSGASLTNTGSWLDQNAFDNRISNDFGGSVSSFSNNGSYTKSGSANVEIGVTFNNPGSVSVQAGSLSLSGGGTSNGGTFDIAPGAVLAFTGGAHALNGISTGSGSGLISVRGGSVDTSASFATAGNLEVSGGALNVGGPGSAAGLLFSGGTIAGTGTLTIAGATQWTAGTLSGSGSTLLNGSATLSGGGFKDITGHAVIFAGVTSWTNTADSNGRIRTGSGASLVNTGNWLDQSAFDNRISNDFGGVASTFSNTGTYTKSGNGTTDLSDAGFSNSGVTDVQAGVIVLPAGFENTGTLQGNGSFATSATLTNSGHVAPGDSIGLLTVIGSFAQTAAGSLDIELQSAGVRDLLVVDGAADLDGILQLICFSGCSFAAGQSMLILDASPNLLSGSFSNVALSGFGATTFAVSYDRANGDVLLTAAVPEPDRYLMFLAGGLLVAHLRRRRRVPV